MHRRDGGFYQRFRAQKLLAQIPAGKILVAVSGGADSVALLHLVHRLSSEKKWEVYCAYIQHRLRGRESIRDQKFVEKLCKKLSIPFLVRSISLLSHPRGGIENAARQSRYRALSLFARKLKSKTILVAHTANDQTETFFLHLIRGCGLDGLRGMPPHRKLSEITGSVKDSGIRIFRPLLGFSRKEIVSYLKSQGLSWREDSSNRNLKFKRNWIRHQLIPLLEKIQPKIVQKISNCALLLQEAKHSPAFLQRKKRA